MTTSVASVAELTELTGKHLGYCAWREITQERINEVQKITLREMDLLVNQYPDKWKRLDSLIYLETMNKHLAELKTGTAQQQERKDREFRELNTSFDRAVMELTQIRTYNDHRLGSRIAGFFGKFRRKRS